MTRDEAIRRVLLIGPYDDDWGMIEEKYNSWGFVCGVKDGVPTEDGCEWYGEVDTCYGMVESVDFRPIKQVLDAHWERLDPDDLAEGSDYRAAWELLGYDVNEALAETA